MSRAASLAELYRASVQEYTRTPEAWKGLLSCAARFYKYSFDNVVLIYAQRPDATQLGTFDEWHDSRIGRSINRGAKSIAVIDMVNPGASLKYLFDFMDTNGSAQSYRNLQRYLWELEEQYRPDILMRFHEKYGTSASDIKACLHGLTGRRVKERLPSDLENFRVRDEESVLYGMPEEAVKAEFMELVEESAAYTVFAKCGISMEEPEGGSFRRIGSYNSLQLFMEVGNCTLSIARSILREIYQEIRAIKTERSRNYENRTIDGLYIQAGRGRDTVSGDTDIRRSADRPDAGGTVRETVERIHDGDVSAASVGTDSRRQDQRGDPAGGWGGRGEERETDPGAAGRLSDAGYGGYDEAGRTHEYDNETGGRDSDGRSGAESKVTLYDSPEKAEPSAGSNQMPAGGFFTVPTGGKETEQAAWGREEAARFMDIVLCAEDLIPDAGIWHSEIGRYFSKTGNLQKKADALKLVYRELDTGYVIHNGNQRVHVSGQDDGMVIRRDADTYFYSYQELSERIDAMIRSGTYPAGMGAEKPEGPAGSGENKEAGEDQNLKGDEGKSRTAAAAQDTMEGTAGHYPGNGRTGQNGMEPHEREGVTGYGATGKGMRYIQAVLRDQSQSLYLQRDTQEFFSTHPDAVQRAGFVKKAYGTGRRELEAEGCLIIAKTRDDGMHIRICKGTENLRISLSWEQTVSCIENLIAGDCYANPDTLEPPGKQEIIDYSLKEKGPGREGGKQRIYQAMTAMLTAKERTAALKKEYGTGGLAFPLENGGHYGLGYNSTGLQIEYIHDGVEVRERLTWAKVEKRIMELIRQDAYLTDEEKAELEQRREQYYPDEGWEVQEEAQGDGKNERQEETEKPKGPKETGGYGNGGRQAKPERQTESAGGQLSLFDMGMETGGGDSPGASGGLSEETGSVGEAEPVIDAGPAADTRPVAGVDTEPAADTEDIQEKDTADRAVSVLHRSKVTNYRFSEEHHLYDGGLKTKFRNNVSAIRLLKELEEQGRMAEPEEQIVLARFAGWGGLANALTPGKSGWEAQYEEIRSLLTEEEFQAAQESTLTAYYTEQSIIRHIYGALEKFGFKGGNILDPAMATGNFFSALPEHMKDSRLYGVEIEPVSGRIAKQLYPDADIQVTGFEKTDYPDQFFDVVIGNIPFNSIKVDDPKYNRYNFRIHDYFLAKSLDKMRPGGIMAVITSKYTMDKASQTVRIYLARRAQLLGAVRLPDNAFRQAAGTEVTADILFFKKREREIVPDEENSPWLSVEKNEEDIPMNQWFIDHPEMVLGRMVFDESMYGNKKSTACHPLPGDDLDERLGRAVSYLEGNYEEPEQEENTAQEAAPDRQRFIPADPAVRNFSYALSGGRLYYREHSRMYEQDITGKKAERIRGLVGITQAVRGLISFQSREQTGLTAEEYKAALQEHIDGLNTVYDRFVNEYGYINACANVTAFSRDASAPLLRSIEKEKKDARGVFEKTAIFYKATIRPRIMPSAVHSAEEALKVSLNVKGRIDLTYMAGLYTDAGRVKKAEDEIIEELGAQIYQDPALYTGDPYSGWQTAGEYLSGYVKDKLAEAVLKAEEEPKRFSRNVEALKAVQPVPLAPQDISFSLGTPWIPTEVYQDFMYETFKTQEVNRKGRGATALEFSRYSGAYFIANKRNEEDSVTAGRVYGTDRMDAYEILEASLNLRFVEVRDRVEYVDPDTGEDKVKYVLNKKETILAREKQAQIGAEFERWLFSDPGRGAELTKLYNDRFNNIRPRVYDGSGLVLPDLSEDITLRPHQLDAVAHGLYGDGNLLMAHEVGAGKTYAAIVLAHELKRLGKASKPLIAVPNHLVGQWSDSYMELYPNDNILVAGKGDFRKQNRRRFVSRIAAGDYDCIIMAHSSFELIGLSRERQLAAMRAELDAVTQAINEQKYNSGQDWSLKQMQIFRKNLQFRYDRLFHAEKKDDVVNFEELGVDALIVDEAHAYKNNYSYTKMRNVAGISGQSSQRAMDMYQKCQYVNEISGGKGVVYLTGTPVSNSMSELYVMQKTLQPRELERRGLLMFDAWAGTFGRVTSSLEIRPEGNGYQMKNRFSQFHNLPELMGMFSMIADIKTADMLNLPVPDLKAGGPQVIRSACTPAQKRIVMELAERAEAIRSGAVDSSRDNFLKLTHEARLLSIDPRAIDPGIEDDPNTKLNLCAENAAKIYHETAKERLTQLIFCDQGTPRHDGAFHFYGAIREALTARGVKAGEIAFIHDAKTDAQREQLFEKVRKGEVRILTGSTEKMGTGMNVQEKLTALHHLDVPWRPADLTQRNGRILRQGNENREVSIFNYITENTFDAYLWQILEQKQRYISQIMTGRSALRTCEDLDETVLQYAEFKALAASDPRVKEKMQTDNEISRLTVLKSAWMNQQNDLHQKINTYYPRQIARKVKEITAMEKDIAAFRAGRTEEFRMVIDGRIHVERKTAAEHLAVFARRLGMKTEDTLAVGSYAGLALQLVRGNWNIIHIRLSGEGRYSTEYGDSGLGNITRIVNLAEHIESAAEAAQNELAGLKQQYAAAKEEYGKPFSDEKRLAELQKKKVQLDLALEFKESSEAVIEEGSAGDKSLPRHFSGRGDGMEQAGPER